jgi:sphingomyelin phosphodiesterase
LYPTPYVKADNISWLYSALAREWTKTGLPSYLSANISNGAFYTIKIFSNLRLISLNTNYCPRENFWLLINSTDPLGQLDWLSKTLQESEDNDEKVHIIGHIHPRSCLKSWSSNYYRIVNRYESVIVGQIFGHTHHDEFGLFYDLDDLKRASSISYIGSSVTTYSNLNPGYRIYTVDGFYEKSTWQILDYDQMFLNLTETNQYNVTKWQTEYSAKEAYNMSSLFPQDWDNLFNQMLSDLDGKLVAKLFKYFWKSSDQRPVCDLSCFKGLICDFKQSRSDNFYPC